MSWRDTIFFSIILFLAGLLVFNAGNEGGLLFNLGLIMAVFFPLPIIAKLAAILANQIKSARIKNFFNKEISIPNFYRGYRLPLVDVVVILFLIIATYSILNRSDFAGPPAGRSTAGELSPIIIKPGGIAEVAVSTPAFPGRQYYEIYFYTDGVSVEFQALPGYEDINIKVDEGRPGVAPIELSENEDFLYDQESGLVTLDEVWPNGATVYFRGAASE